MGVIRKSKSFKPLESTDIGQIGGSGTALAVDTIYQAKTDGFVYLGEKTDGQVYDIKIDEFTPPTTIRAIISSGYNTQDGKAIPVAAGEYWQATHVIGSNAIDFIYWRPQS